MYCGTYLFYSFPSEYLFRANGYSGVYAGISLRVVPEPESTEAPAQIILIPVSISYRQTPQAGIRSAQSLIATVPVLNPAGISRVVTDRRLSAVVAQSQTAGISRITVSYQARPALYSQQIIGASRITQNILGNLRSLTVTESGFARLSVENVGRIVGPLTVHDSVVPPGMTVAYSFWMLPLSIPYVATIQPSRITEDIVIRGRSSYYSQVLTSVIRRDSTIQPASVITYSVIGISRARLGQNLSPTVIGASVRIQNSFMQSTYTIIPNTNRVTVALAYPLIQGQIGIYSQMLLSGSTLISIDWWRY